MNRKAALELSITAIVVLIIAITVLGLGIGFIKKQFGESGKIIEEQLTGIKQQLRDQIRTGGELLVVSVPDQVSIGKQSSIVIGVRNTAANLEGDKVCFRLEVKCIQPYKPESQCFSDVQGPAAVGGYDSDAGWQPVTSNHNWFRSLLSQFDLKNYEGDVFDGIILVRGVAPDSYQMEINVYREPEYRDCSAKSFGDKKESLYASKSFTLNVVQ